MREQLRTTVVCVDDDEDERRALAWVLEAAGLEVQETATGGEGLRLAGQNPGLVVLDVNLPDIDGFEVCRRIKAHPATAAIPVLHLSGVFVTPLDVSRALAEGADGYLTKPVDPWVLLAWAKALLRSYQTGGDDRAARALSPGGPREGDAEDLVDSLEANGYGSGTSDRPRTLGESGRAGESTMAEEVFFAYASRVYAVARRMLANDADAEDVTQDVLIQVIRKLDTFRGEACLATWLHRVTVNAALDHRRKQFRRRERQVDAPLDALSHQAARHAPSQPEPPDRQVLDRELQGLIEQAIAGLPEKYRNVYVLGDVEDRPYAEIGELLGLSLPAVKSRLHRARLMMREALASHF